MDGQSGRRRRKQVYALLGEVSGLTGSGDEGLQHGAVSLRLRPRAACHTSGQKISAIACERSSVRVSGISGRRSSYRATIGSVHIIGPDWNWKVAFVGHTRPYIGQYWYLSEMARRPLQDAGQLHGQIHPLSGDQHSLRLHDAGRLAARETDPVCYV